MRSGGSANPSVVRRVDRPARHSAPRQGTTPAVAAAGTPPAVTAGAGPILLLRAAAMAAGRTPPAVGAILQVRARCTRRCAPSVGGTRKSPSSPARTSRCTAGSASSCGGRRLLRATIITRLRTEAAHERGGRKAAPFCIRVLSQGPSRICELCCPRTAQPSPRRSASVLPSVQHAHPVDPDIAHSG